MPEEPWPTITVRTKWIPSGADELVLTLFQVETYMFPFACVFGLFPRVAVRLNEMPPAKR